MQPVMRTVRGIGLGDESDFTICVVQAEGGFIVKLPNWTDEDFLGWRKKLDYEQEAYKAERGPARPGIPRAVLAGELMRPLHKLVLLTGPTALEVMLDRLEKALAGMHGSTSLGNISWQNEGFEIRIAKLTSGYVVDFDRLVEIDRLTFKRRHGTAVYADWETLRRGIAAFYDPKERPEDEG